jgi:transcriptional regulator with XRE-family HTH domain
MSTGKSDMKDFRPAKRHVEVSPGEPVRILRELQELCQNELAELSGIPQSTISAVENDRFRLGVERAKVLARALKGHPAIRVFPGWDVGIESAARQARHPPLGPADLALPLQAACVKRV